MPTNTWKIAGYSDKTTAKILVSQPDYMDTDSRVDRHFLIKMTWTEICFEFTVSPIKRNQCKS